MNDTESHDRSVNLLIFSLIAVFVGVVTGFGAVLFRALIRLVHNADFLPAPSPRPTTPTSTRPHALGRARHSGAGDRRHGRRVPGQDFAPEARGHGVPEVMDAIFYKDGASGPWSPSVKSLASALSIGSGCRGGPRRADHPDRRVARLDASASRPDGSLAAHHAGRGGRGRGHRRHVQHADRRRDVRHRADDAGSQRRAPFCRWRWPPARRPSSAASSSACGRPSRCRPQLSLSTSPPRSMRCCSMRCSGVIVGLAATALHPRPAFRRGSVRAHRESPICATPSACAIVGAMMYAFLAVSGHYHVEGVGYATIQDILLGGMAPLPLLALLFAAQAARDVAQPGLGFVGRHLLAVAVHGRDARRRVRRGRCSCCFPAPTISIPAFAMVGMAAMVGGGTGAAMTAVTMIFEMTRDYDIVMPMIVAVAISIGVRRVLSRENIYTIKLVARRHFIPKALHANMFLVRRGGRRHGQGRPRAAARHAVRRVPAAARARRRHAPHRRHRRRPDRRRAAREHGAAPRPGGRLHRRTSGRGREPRLHRSRARRTSCSTSSGACGAGRRPWWWWCAATGVPRAADVIGVITKEHIADSVAESIKPYAAADAHL